MRKKYARKKFISISMCLIALFAFALAAGLFLAVYLEGGQASAVLPTPKATPTPMITATPASEAIPTPATTPTPTNLDAPLTPPPTLPPYQWGEAVAASDPVEDTYFEDAVFIGDSRTEGLKLYSGLKSATFLCGRGMTVKTAINNTLSDTSTGAGMTVVQAVQNKRYGKVYIMLGMNELGWVNNDIFYQTYQDLVQQIKQAAPGATIYIQTLMPVTAWKSEKHDYVKNEKIKVYNELIEKLAREEKVYLLDTFQAVVGPDGTLPDEATSDGIHLNKAYCKIWLAYLRTHTV